MTSHGWVELHEWTPIATTTGKDDKGEKKPREPRHAKRQYEGREQEAKNVKGSGQWASLGELLM